ncbi:hypothetical protein [Teredinibacter purpureus]|uniref:hypothetical protein n=1 Tax=Teredinibacter purpureus TaxID=2731756 RepID=UPI000A81AA41|nr:hypothetical protein [Teredinibacter purpureus]
MANQKSVAIIRALKCVSLSGLCVGMVACGGSGQDEGTQANINTMLTGRVIDGYLARATVFVDTNNNGTRDPWEPFAFTDNEGYFSYNPNTDTDYCAAGASANLQQYCLNLTTDIANFTIRIDSGYDILTGEPFFGQMSRRVDFGVENDILITPLSTLVTVLDDSETQSALLLSLGLEDGDLDIDYLHADSFNLSLLNKALTVHKSVSLMSDRITDVYSEIGNNLGTPNDASQSVYRSLAEQLVIPNTDLNTVLQSEASLASILDSAEASIRDIYTLREFDLPPDMGSVEVPNGFSRVIDITQTIPVVVNEIFNTEIPATTIEEIIGGVRLIETVVVKGLDEIGSTDLSLDNAINFITEPENSEAVVSLTGSLSGADSFVSELRHNDFTGDDFISADDFDRAVRLPEGAQAFSDVVGTTVRLSDPDLGFGPNSLKDIEVALFFTGEQNALAGGLQACVKYIEDASTDGSLGEGNTRGEYIDGFWSLLGASSVSDESYSLLITITFLGATYQAIIKPGGTVGVGDDARIALRFDFDGDIRNWDTANGFEQAAVLPVNSQDCEALLPSRVGL